MRFIQVGVGGFGKVWLRTLSADKQAHMAALVDINGGTLKAACEQYGYSPDICYPSLEDALKHVDADAVVSCTPPRFHRHDVVTAMRAGLHAISEKPMAESMRDCRAMLEASRATGRTYVVSQNYRYRPSTWSLGKFVREGRLGAVGQVRIDFFKGVQFSGFRAEMEYPLIVDMAIHHFDLIRFITGLDAVSVRAEAWNPAWSHYRGECSSAVVFEMSNGARVLYNGSWCSKGEFCDWNGNWQIEGDKGTLVYEKGSTLFHDVPEGYKPKRTRPIKDSKLPREGQAFVLRDFMRAVKTGEPARTDVRDNIKSVAMVFAVVQAMRTGRKVAIRVPE